MPPNDSDRPGQWSEERWDDRGFYYSSRVDAVGHLEYDYRYPEVPQTLQQQQTVPRSPGPNIITSSEVFQSSSGSSSTSTYTAQPTPAYAPIESPSTTSFGVPYTDPLPSSAAPATSYDPQVTTAGHRDPTSAELPAASTIARPLSVESNASTTRGTASSSSLTTSTSPSASNARYSSFSSEHESLTTQVGTLSIDTPSTSSAEVDDSFYLQQSGDSQPSSSSADTRLDERYKTVSIKNEKAFWKVGRVFLALWTEPAREGLTCSSESETPGAPSASSQVTKVYLGCEVFSEIRRFVVLREGWGNSVCSPIHTYGRQATLKPNLPDAQQHAIIYTTPRPPSEFWLKANNGSKVTENLSKDPIKVNKAWDIGADGDLGKFSRLNYSKLYTVEHFVRVRNIGMVDAKSMSSLLDNGLVKPRDPPTGPRRHLPRSGGHDSKRKSKH